MKRILLKSKDKLFEETEKTVKGKEKKKLLEEQIMREAELIKQFDPDRELKEEFQIASLYDLQKYLND